MKTIEKLELTEQPISRPHGEMDYIPLLLNGQYFIVKKINEIIDLLNKENE